MLRVGMHPETDFRKLLQDATKLDPATEYGQIGDLVDALKRIDPNKRAEADRRELWKFYEAKRSLRLAVLRHKIIKEHAIDVLAKEVLGYKVQPFHLAQPTLTAHLLRQQAKEECRSINSQSVHLKTV